MAERNLVDDMLIMLTMLDQEHRLKRASISQDLTDKSDCRSKKDVATLKYPHKGMLA